MAGIMDKYAGRPLLIIAGPTGVGKSDIALKIAKRNNGEIISADSVAVYKGLDIGSAKPDKAMQAEVTHHLIDILDPDEYFGIDEFVSYASRSLEEIYDAGHLPIVTGGTGFYIQALLYGIEFNDEEDHEDGYREDLYKLAEEANGPEKLHQMLKDIDPEYAQNVHPNNIKRVVRALEYNRHTGRLFSELNKEQRARTSCYDFLYTAIDLTRQKLYERIDRRVDLMIDAGLEAEVRGLLKAGYLRELNSMSSIGYKEMCAYIDGERSLEQAIEDIKRNSRHYAKRQLTWLKREKDVWLITRNLDDQNDEGRIVSLIEDKMSECGMI